jgi:hypothetical protein
MLAETIAVEPPFFTPFLPLRYQKMYNDLSQMV